MPDFLTDLIFWPYGLTLRREAFLGGDHPNYADHIAGGAFIGFSYIVEKPLLAPDDPLQAWVDRGAALARACPVPAPTMR